MIHFFLLWRMDPSADLIVMRGMMIIDVRELATVARSGSVGWA